MPKIKLAAEPDEVTLSILPTPDRSVDVIEKSIPGMNETDRDKESTII